jgi:hypothetical protein
VQLGAPCIADHLRRGGAAEKSIRDFDARFERR